MDCELAQQKIALFAYGELPDDQCHALEGHLATCKRCQEEFAAVQALQQAMALAPALEPSANLLAQARLRLEEALDNMPRSSWLMRVQQSMFRGVSMLGRAPVAASALLVLGLGAGSLGWLPIRSRAATTRRLNWLRRSRARARSPTSAALSASQIQKMSKYTSIGWSRKPPRDRSMIRGYGSCWCWVRRAR